MATPTGLSFPSSHSTSSFAAARAFGVADPRAAAAGRGGRDGVQPALSRRPLPVRRRRGSGARDGHREPRAMMKVGLVGMPNAGKSSLFNALSQAGAEAANYPFTTIEPNVAVVPGQGRADGAGRRDHQGLQHRLGHDRVPRHRGPGRGRVQGRGPGQQVPGQHPRVRRAAARRALPHRREHPAPGGHGRSGARHRDDRDRAAARRPRFGGAPARPGRARRPLGRQGRGRRGEVAAPGDRGAAGRHARARRPGAARTRPTPRATCTR